MNNNIYLEHHGVLNQRWGHRRYQNKDGSLTEAGKKRAAKLRDKYEKVTGKKDISDKKQINKSVSEMTDEELRTKIARKRLENEYYSYYPVQVKRGKQFINNLKNEMVREIPKVLTNQVTNVISKTFNRKIDDYLKESEIPYKELFKKDISKMTDAELRRASDRLNNEHTYMNYKAGIFGKKDKKNDNDDNNGSSRTSNNFNRAKPENNSDQTKSSRTSNDFNRAKPENNPDQTKSSTTNQNNSGYERVKGKNVKNPFAESWDDKVANAVDADYVDVDTGFTSEYVKRHYSKPYEKESIGNYLVPYKKKRY